MKTKTKTKKKTDSYLNQQRLAESTIRTFIYFSSSTSRSRRRTAIVVIIIKLIQSITSLSETTTTTTTTTATDQTEDDEREETNQRLRSILESTNDSLEILINLLSLLTLLNKHNNRLITLIATTTDLTHHILSYAHSSLQKAALWKLGRKTRLEIADTDQTIKALKPLIRSTSIQHQQQQQSALIDQINAHIQLNRARKITLKRCKRGLQRIYWARIVFTIDALLSGLSLHLLSSQLPSFHGLIIFL
jgi:hypothetical protein